MAEIALKFAAFLNALGVLEYFFKSSVNCMVQHGLHRMRVEEDSDYLESRREI